MTPWGRAITALRLLQLDPNGLGGLLLEARSGPVRDAFLDLLPKDTPRLHPAMSQDALLGGVDVSSSLSQGALVRQRGLLETSDQLMVLSMAERTPPLMATSIASFLDNKQRNALIALDEHLEDEAPPPLVLRDRLAFHICIDEIGLNDIEATTLDDPVDAAPVHVPENVINDIALLAMSLGITSLRAPLLALNAARAHAALNHRDSVTSQDILAAAELVLPPRATQVPQPPEPSEPDTSEPDQAPQEQNLTDLPQDILLEAIKTALPEGLLTKAASNTDSGAAGSGAGQRQVGNRKGRPLPARDSNTRPSQARVDLMATLRAAVPWQKLRKQSQNSHLGPVIHPRDLRYKRYEDLSDRLLIFLVDASGSAAIARLAEAKGAVELLLAEAYAKRDHVALIAFRGTKAEVLLPPTRSLVQTKRRLADLPGGGGTPLASGLKAGLETAENAKRKGLSPVIILLTDGRSNIALDGTPDRAQAAEDATRWATQIALARIDSMVIDTGKRPEKALRNLAASLRGHYASLPRADAQGLSDTVSSALER